ncbi:MAG: hypothetical protein AB7F89_14035 [Pirellulaceae bacterium]
MTITTTCAGCGTQYQVGDALAGKRAKCKRCGQIITVPYLATAATDVGLDPLGGDWSSAGPLGGADHGGFGLGPAAHSAAWQSPLAAPGKPFPSSQGADAGLGKMVWIAGGLGITVCVLLFGFLTVRFLFKPRTNPAAATAELPAQGEAPGAAPREAPASVAPAKRSNVPTLVNDSVAWQWSGGSPATVPANFLQSPVQLSERPTEMYCARPELGLLTLVTNRYGQRPDVLVQRVDLKTSQPSGEHSFPQNTKILDASPDGSAVALVPAEKFAAQEDIEVWKWSNGALQKAGAWQPYASQTSKRFAWCRMLDADRVITFHSQDDSVVAWNAAQGTEVFRLPCKSTQPLLPVASGKLLADFSGLWLRFFQSDNGRHVGSLGPLSDEYASLAAVAISADRRSLGALFVDQGAATRTVAVFDLGQGKLQQEIETPYGSAHLQWVGPQHLLAGTHLVSLEHAMTVWDYSGLQPVPQASDPRVWYVVASGSEQYLAAATVPSAQVVAKSAEFAAANVPILKSGDSVSLQVEASGTSLPAGFSGKLTESLRGKLAASGYQVGEGQPFRLDVAVREEDSGRQLEYRMFGGGSFSTVQVPDRRIKCKVAFVDRSDKEVWQQSREFAPASMSFNRGGGDFVQHVLESRWQSLDQYIQGLRIPGEVRRFSSLGKFGTARLSPTGEQILSVPTP